jgi:hypothetical protein
MRYSLADELHADPSVDDRGEVFDVDWRPAERS